MTKQLWHPEAVEIGSFRRLNKTGAWECLYSDGTIRTKTGEYICPSRALGGREAKHANLLHRDGMIATMFGKPS